MRASFHEAGSQIISLLLFSTGFLARAVNTLPDLSVKRPARLTSVSPTWSVGHDRPDRGYPVTFNGLPVSTHAHHHELLASSHHRWSPKCDGSPLSRVIFYDIWDEHRGLDDRVYAITTWLSFARDAEAALVFPDPNSSFSDGHGHASAQWWDEYYEWSPPVFRFKEAKCAEEAEEINITAWKNLADWPRPARHAFFDKTKPLCIRFQNGDDTQNSIGETMQSMITRGAEKVSVWTSRTVTRVVRDVFAEVPDLHGGYNAAHVRLGDKVKRGGVLCNNASYVVDRMERCRAQHGDAADRPWLLMSDGGSDFFRNMTKESRAHRFKIVSENDIKTLNDLTDNFLRYTVLSCIWGASDIGIATYKRLGHYCHMQQGHSVGMMFLPCTSKKEASTTSSLFH